MKWTDKHNNGKPTHPQSVIEFCCNNVLVSGCDGTPIPGFTEHVRYCEEENTRLRFRCHPSYRENSGQSSGLWYDWAYFLFHDDKSNSQSEYPCQILCFLDLRKIQQSRLNVNPPGLYAVARSFKSRPTNLTHTVGSNFVLSGNVMDDLCILPCDSIYDSAAVVQNTREKEITEQHNANYTNVNWHVKLQRYAWKHKTAA